MLLSSLALSSAQMDWKTVETCAMVRWVHVSAWFWGKKLKFCVPKVKWIIQTVIRKSSKSQHLSRFEVQQCPCHGWLPYAARWHWHRGKNWNFRETFSVLPSRWRLCPGSPWLYMQDNARPHSPCTTMAWSRRHRVPASRPDLSPLENQAILYHVMLMRLTSRIKQEWAKLQILVSSVTILQASNSKFVYIYKIHLRRSVNTLEIFTSYIFQLHNGSREWTNQSLVFISF